MQGKSVLPEVLLGEMVRSIGRNGSFYWEKWFVDNFYWEPFIDTYLPMG